MTKSAAARSFVPAALSMTGFVVLCCVLLYTAVKRELFLGALRQEVQLAGIVSDATRHAMLKSDNDALTTIVANVGSHTGVEHLRIFNKKGHISFSAAAAEVGRTLDKRSDGCLQCHSGPTPLTSLGPMEQAREFVNEKGQPVLAITAPIYNAPECVGPSCHNARQQVLGTLDIGISRRPFQSTLTNLRWQMAAFSVMVLVLTLGWTAILIRQRSRAERGQKSAGSP